MDKSSEVRLGVWPSTWLGMTQARTLGVHNECRITTGVHTRLSASTCRTKPIMVFSGSDTLASYLIHSGEDGSSCAGELEDHASQEIIYAVHDPNRTVREACGKTVEGWLTKMSSCRVSQ